MSERIEALDTVSEWGVGLGILLVQLFPLSLPILLLTLVVLLVLALPLIVIGSAIALPVFLVRRLRRRPDRTPREAAVTGRRGEPSLFTDQLERSSR